MTLAQVVRPSEPAPDGVYLTLVESPEPLELGQVLAIAPTKPAPTLVARFLAVGDEVEGSVRVETVEHGNLYATHIGDVVPVVFVTWSGGVPFTYDAYDEVTVLSRVCEDCDRVFTTTASTWPDRRQCPTCAGVLDPMDRPGPGF